MIDCAISSAEGKSLELQYQGDTPPLCKVFALDKDWQPLRACTSYTLSLIHILCGKSS